MHLTYITSNVIMIHKVGLVCFIDDETEIQES